MFWHFPQCFHVCIRAGGVGSGALTIATTHHSLMTSLKFEDAQVGGDLILKPHRLLDDHLEVGVMRGGRC